MKRTLKLDLSTIIKQSTGIITQNLEEDTVMANIDSGRYFGVDSTAKFIWEQLATAITVENICKKVLEEYDIDTETCEREVLLFVQKLADENLLEFEEC